MVNVLGKAARGAKTGVDVATYPLRVIGDVLINQPDPSGPQSYGWDPDRFPDPYRHPDDEFASKMPGVFFDPLGALGNLARKIATNGPSGEVVPVVPDDDPQPSSSSSSSKPGLIPPVKRKPKTKDQQKMDEKHRHQNQNHSG